MVGQSEATLRLRAEPNVLSTQIGRIPWGDLLPILLACDATIRCVGPHGVRDIAAADFFLDYRKTARAAEELIASVDAVLVTTRRAETHLPCARLCLEAGKPVVVDKPFAANSREAKEMARLSAERSVPLIAGSTICFLPEIPEWRAALSEAKTVLLRYWADPDSPCGGFRVYGSHLTDLACALFDGERRVRGVRTGGVVSCIVEYGERQVLLQTSAHHAAVEAVYDDGGSLVTLRLDDGNCYARGLEAFFRGIRDGAPEGHHERLIASVRLLCAVDESLRSGLPQRVEDF